MSEELFPKTAEEHLATVRAKLQGDVDKCHEALARAEDKCNTAEALLAVFDEAIAEQGATLAMVDKRLADAQARLGERGADKG